MVIFFRFLFSGIPSLYNLRDLIRVFSIGLLLHLFVLCFLCFFFTIIHFGLFFIRIVVGNWWELLFILHVLIFGVLRCVVRLPILRKEFLDFISHLRSFFLFTNFLVLG